MLNIHKIIGDVLEPCAGNGNIVKTVKDKYSNINITSIEIRPEEKINLQQYGKVYIEDYLTWEQDKYYNTIITNPPFSIAQQILEKSFEISDSNTQIIMLLRLAFLESKKRNSFWQKHPVDCIYVLSDRPSFTGKGTDASAYGWFVWNTIDKGIKVI